MKGIYRVKEASKLALRCTCFLHDFLTKVVIYMSTYALNFIHMHVLNGL